MAWFHNAFASRMPGSQLETKWRVQILQDQMLDHNNDYVAIGWML
jgi:hypothetical protein